MELPEELRQLADIQKLRREKAIKGYRMNEDGLLIRPAMELKEGNDPQKDGNYRDDGDCFPTNKAVSQITSFYNQEVLCQEKLENQNEVVNLWKNLKLTSSWLHESNFWYRWLDELRLGIWRHPNEKRGYSPCRSVKQKLLSLQWQVNPLLNGKNDGLSFEGNSFFVWLFFSRSMFEIHFFFSRAIFDFKTVTFVFLALLPDQCLKLYWFFCYLLQVCKTLIQSRYVNRGAYKMPFHWD